MNRKLKGTMLAIALSTGLLAAQTPASAPQQDASGASSQPQGGHRRGGTGGVITAISEGKITIKTMDGKTATVILSDKTQFHVDRQPAKLTDFKVGDAVLVRGDASGENELQADVVAKRANNAGEGEFRDALGKRFIVGEIKAISGVQLSILRPDGVTQTITVDENTSIRKQGESITLADFKVGDHVYGRGEVKDGVFVPAVLGWGDPMQMLGGQGAPDKSQGK
jgi:hypothetical protein